MKAYAILDGGGVKGAALAGCLAAAEEHGIRFAGFGGTSAGSIVATLATVGYDGNSIRQLLKSTMSPNQMLDDGGGALRRAKGYPDEMMRIMSENSLGIIKCWKLKNFVSRASNELQPVLQGGGLYNGERLKTNMIALIKAGLKKYRGCDLDNKQDICFVDLASAGCPPLKIVATDITRKRAAPYSLDDKEYSNSVIEAVRASACYPFLFKPVSYTGGATVVDGGLSSNLPIFLFAGEREQTRYPLLAFDLISRAQKTSANPLVQIANDFLDTALEASDSLILDLIPGVEYVPIQMPDGIDTLKFDLSDIEIDLLFAAGHEATSKYLKSFRRLNSSKLAGPDIPKQLQGIYGDRKLFEPVLWACATMIQERTQAKDLRCQIMLSTGRKNNSRIVVYHHGYRTSDSDVTLELGEYVGCTGASLKYRTAVCADLEDARKNFNFWGMNQEDQNLIPGDRNSMLSIPIFSSLMLASPTSSNEGPHMLGTLSIDSSTKILDTEWVEKGWSGTTPHVNVNSPVVTILKTWAAIIGQLFKSQESQEPQESEDPLE